MKRIVIAAALFAIALGTVPSQAEGEQTVEGSALLPTRFTDVENGFPGLPRRVYLASMGNANGIFGYIFDVDPATQGGTFTVGDVADLTGAGDLDIFFYYDLGDDVYGERPPATAPDGEFQTRAPGGETGTVPDDVIAAIVFSTNAINATFTYTATPAG